MLLGCQMCEETLLRKLNFESILTSFKLSIIFGGSWSSTENWLEPKTKPPSGNLACPNLQNSL